MVITRTISVLAGAFALVGAFACDATSVPDDRTPSWVEIDPSSTRYPWALVENFELVVSNTGLEPFNVTEVRLDYQPVSEMEATDPDGPALRLVPVNLPAHLRPVNLGPYDEPWFLKLTVLVRSYADCLTRPAILTIRNDNDDHPERREFQIRFDGVAHGRLSVSQMTDWDEDRYLNVCAMDKLSIGNVGNCDLTVDKVRFSGDPQFAVVVGGQELLSSTNGEQVLASPVTLGPNTATEWAIKHNGLSSDVAHLEIHSSDPTRPDGYLTLGISCE